MSPNKNYLAGRRLEYEVMRTLEKKGFRTIRASGSHGQFDVVGYDEQHKPLFVQCKRCSTESEAKALRKAFIDLTVPSEYYHQQLVIKIKGTKTPMETTI